MGRTGTLWAYERYGVRPDVMTLAKGLGGGLPIGALSPTPELADVFAPGDHGSTFAGNPLVSAAANAALDVLDDPALLETSASSARVLVEGLRELPRRELGPRPRPDGGRRGRDGRAGARPPRADEQRLIINATGPGTLRFLPPLVVSEAEVAEALGRLGALLR